MEKVKNKADLLTNMKGRLSDFPKGKNGSVSKLFYAIPLLFWMTYGASLVAKGDLSRELKRNNAKRVNIVKNNNSIPMPASDLQGDINYISEKKGGTTLFEKSKKEIIKASAKENFLMETMARQTERSIWARSMGTEDGEGDGGKEYAINEEIVPDSTGIDTSINAGIKTRLDYVMDSYKYKSDDPKNNVEKEAERIANVEAGIAENRRRREKMEEESTLKAEAEAYRKGVEDYAEVTKNFSLDGTGLGTDSGDDSRGDLQAGGKRKDRKIKNETLSFHTQTGTRDDLKKGEQKSEGEALVEMLRDELGSREEKDSHENAKEQINVTSGLQILEGSIDQGVKLKTGDKVQIRILEKGFYKGREIPRNTILYGICSMSGSRIKIKIPAIRLGDELLKSSLKVYDPDGLEGIYVDGFYDDFTKGIIDEGIREGANLGVKLPFSNMSLNLGRKANKKTSANVPSGYRVFLYDAGKGEKSVTLSYQNGGRR